jgi:hypothetical protein
MKTPETPPLTGFIAVLLILFLPLAGITLTGKDPRPFLQIPPAAGYTIHAQFSWPVFIILTAGILLIIIHPLMHIIRNRNWSEYVYKWNEHLPWWGWCGIVLCVLTWFIAWTRFPLFAVVQRWTFTPLWISYIIIINSFCYMRTGSSLLSHHTSYLLKLFPLSAAFWWIFEYLNRFTSNWYYSGTGELSTIRYIAEASLAFSTVLPAVMSTASFLHSFPGFYAGMDSYIKINLYHRKLLWFIVFLLSGTGLAFTGIFPEILFPLLWIAPLLIVVSLSAMKGKDTVFSGIGSGDWRNVVVYAAAALMCGFFWEMWNINSMAKWIYSIPYVQGFKIFEMPLPGYAGYFPFGLECAVVAGFVSGIKNSI